MRLVIGPLLPVSAQRGRGGLPLGGTHGLLPTALKQAQGE